MSHQNTIFYQEKQVFTLDFTAEKVSSEGGIALLSKIERKYHIIKSLSESIEDKRHESYTRYDIYDLLKVRVFMILLGYEDANDVDKLKNDELFSKMLNGSVASQPTISRFENSVDRHQIFDILEHWLDRYIDSLKGRKQVTIDIDATDAETFGNQQLTLYNGFYGHYMYNELFFHDGDTGQIILPVLRPGNAHSNWWYTAILKRIVKKIREKYPDIKVFIRADSGFSTPKFYNLSREFNLKYVIGVAANEVLKRKTESYRNMVDKLFVRKGVKRQIFVHSFKYQAGSWDEPEKCYAKIESTGKGLNVRYFISNFENKSAKEIYRDFYIKRGETSENRIKEVKNMCFSDRMSNHNFEANFFRLIISSLAYEFMLVIKQKIKKTGHEKAKKWQVDNIRLFLLKIGGFLKETKRRVIIKLSKSAPYQDLYLNILHLS